ncbi:MAG: hypothetical protein HOP16_10520 [Acidobacteria bacterium]|nr:hypothetical protein [Acidobacteriota bacterium]
MTSHIQSVSHLGKVTTSSLVSRPVEISPARAHAPRAVWLLASAVAGVCVAGFWNVRAVDGLGVTLFVSPVVGAFEGIAGEFAVRGHAFGVLFAVAAGLAATITASNIASFALLPLLILAMCRSWRAALLGPLAITAATVACVGAVYGVFIGRLGPEGAAAFNAGGIRGAQSFVVFGTIGVAMLVAAAYEFGLFDRFTSGDTSATRTFLAQRNVRAAMVGLAIGGFTIGRPLAVFREVLLYAAQPSSPVYGALVMATQALANFAVPAIVVASVVATRRERIALWASDQPQKAAAISACALAAGGAFLTFYWAISRVWPPLGRWGFQLGMYQ